ncbi:MAG: Uma2 family endonuclease [Byssovorax sp.]
MGHPSEPPPTFEELYAKIRALPEHITGEILTPGVLRTRSRPGKKHRRAARACLWSLDPFDANVGGTGWWIEPEVEIRFPGGRLTVPDLCGYRVERVPELPDDNPLAILPDWCCEVLSPRTASEDLTVKLPLYARSGVTWNWIVDPIRKLVEVFETVGGRPALTATAKADERVVLPPFGAEFAVVSFWIAGHGEQEEEE